MKPIKSRRFLEGHKSPQHENPQRLELLLKRLSRLPDSAIDNRKDLASLFHSHKYIASFREACRKSKVSRVFFGETPISPETFDLAGYAIGASIQAAELALDNHSGEGGLALVRPPGHHATRNMPRVNQGLGFCFFNNSAIAALYLARKNLRVFIYDCDLHQGNGTQQAVMGNPNIVFLSTQQEGSWPSPFVNTRLSRKNCHNLVFPSGCSDNLYLDGNDKYPGAKDTAYKLITQFKPDVVLLSLGADGYYKDFGVLGDVYEVKEGHNPVKEGFHLSQRTYTEIRNIIGKSKRRFAILEGGYNAESVAEVAEVFLK